MTKRKTAFLQPYCAAGAQLVLCCFLLPLSCIFATTPDLGETASGGLSVNEWSGIRAAHQDWKYRFVESGNGTFSATNPGQRWRMTFDGRGFLANPESHGWRWGLELVGYGVGQGRHEVRGTVAGNVQGTRLSFQRDEILEEWFVNDGRGLEQGWTLNERPVGDGDGKIRLYLVVRGGLLPVIADDGGKSLGFLGEDGVVALTYGGLKAWDATGRDLPTRFVVGEDGISVEVDEQGDVTYPVMIDPVAQLAYLKASNTGADDRFGNSVSVSGDTVVVGAPHEDSGTTDVNSVPDEAAGNAGAAYVFTRDEEGIWSQEAYLKAGNAGNDDQFGSAVSISGDTIVVGAVLESSSTSGVNSTPDDDLFGAGAAYVFTRNEGEWSQQAYLKASNTDSFNNSSFNRFGFSVSVEGDTLVVGAYSEDSSTTGVDSVPDNSGTDTGAAYVFTRDSGGAWSQQAYLKASNTGDDDEFGFSVSVSGDMVVVGARFEDSTTTGVDSTPDDAADNAGAAYVFMRDGGGEWSQQAYLKASNTGDGDLFGSSVSASADTVVVGALFEDSGTTGVNSVPDDATLQSGAAYVFIRDGAGAWSEEAYLKASNTGFKDFFGHSVSISDNTLIVGARGESSSSTGVDSVDDDLAIDAGAAYVFTRSGGVWSQQAYLKASNAEAGDGFGRSVSVSGETAVIGAFTEDSGTTGIDSEPDNSAELAGAAYIFEVPRPPVPPTSLAATIDPVLKSSLLNKIKKFKKKQKSAKKKGRNGKAKKFGKKIRKLRKQLRLL